MPDDMESELEALRARYAELDIDAELARAGVVEWRWTTGNATFYRPLPRFADSEHDRVGEYLDRPHGGVFPEQVGLDGDRRVVAQLNAAGTEFERVQSVWRWEDDAYVELDRRHVIRWTASTMVRAGRHFPDRIELRRSETRIEGADELEDGIRPFARELRGDRILVGFGERAETFAVALAAATAIAPDRILWDGRVSEPEPWPEDPQALIEPLARALDTALRAGGAGVAEPYLLKVSPYSYWQRPPVGRIASRVYRDRIRAASRNDGEALSLDPDAPAADVLRYELVELLDETSLRACRALATASARGMPRERNELARPIVDAVLERLAELLCGQPWPGAAEPFLPLVMAHDEQHTFARARRIAGDERVDAFLESVRSRAPRGRGAKGDPLTSRVALEAHLRAHGLDTHAHRLAHDVAQEGMLLIPGDGPSHFGAPALLPPGEPWPQASLGTPLTFLARIGDLLFFAAFRYDDEEDGLIDEAPNTPGSPIRVFHTSDPQPADGPALASRPLTLRPVLTLPTGHAAAKTAGLDLYEAKMLEEATDALAQRLHPGERYWQDEHWFGGLATGVQGVAPSPGTELLLHIAWDEELGFEFADGGIIQFRVPAEALAAGDWSRVVAYGDSS